MSNYINQEDEKPEPKIPSLKEETYDDKGEPGSTKAEGSAFASALKEAKAECKAEHTQLAGVATRANGPTEGKGSSKSTYGAGVD